MSDLTISNSGVYTITNTVNGKMYVGSSARLVERMQDHLSYLRRGRHVNPHLQAAFIKYGEAAFQFQIIEKTAESVEREQHYIDTLKPAYNIAPRAGTTAGCKQSSEARKKRSLAWLGDKHPFFGKHHSLETRTKISASRKGKNCGQANSNFGKTHSEETRRKISATRKKRPVERISISGEIVCYPYLRAVKADGFHDGHVVACCKGQSRSHKGYQWRYSGEITR